MSYQKHSDGSFKYEDGSVVDCHCKQAPEFDNVVACDKCNVWSHKKCVQYVEETDFLCDKCKTQTNNSNDTETESESEQEYQVEKIVDWDYDVEMTIRLFLVKWKNYSSKHNSWVSETELKKCGDILKEFTDRRNIDPPKFEYQNLVGASTSKRIQLDNLTDINKIEKT